MRIKFRGRAMKGLLSSALITSVAAMLVLPANAEEGQKTEAALTPVQITHALAPNSPVSTLSEGVASSRDGRESTIVPSSKDAGELTTVSSSDAFQTTGGETKLAGVQWKSLMNHSLFFLGVMHSFRFATEPSTRTGLHNSVAGGYLKALGSMHGWSDGDGYYENYLGHPIEGAVSGYIWIHNDPRYRNVQFGGERDYWMSRLRAYAFAWAFSEQFEIGPISEASIGQIQRYCCGYGFVDHVITPNGGLVWMLAGDAVDRFITVPLENRTRNKVVRALARSALNPPQSFANMMSFQYPWHRENRATVSDYDGQMYLRPSGSLTNAIDPAKSKDGFGTMPKFELTASMPALNRIGGMNCLGGEGTGAFRLSEFMQWTVEVGGCTLGNSLARNWSGDSLTFVAGPQWIFHNKSRWVPHAHFRIGGQKVTEEYENVNLKKVVLSQVPPDKSPNDYHDQYTKHFESTGFSLAVGGGLDITVNRALALRIANFDYTRSWLGTINNTDFGQGYRLSTGLVLRIGTW